jgi:hypothetical protein
MPKKGFDLETYYRHTMSQELARKIPYLSDYACNVYAHQIAMIDAILEVADPEEKENLQTLREILLKVGSALWVMQATELTNLGLKLGTPIKEASLKGREMK